MKIVFFGYDFSIDIVRRMISDGHTILKIFANETDNRFAFNLKLKELSDINQIPFTTQRATKQDIETLYKNDECECFFSSGYAHKIPDVTQYDVYALNLHPTLLPRGRGAMVMPHVFFGNEEACGLTIHKLAPAFDSGDVLYQEPLPMIDEEDIDTLSARIAMRAPDLVSMVLKDIETYWKNASPQEESNAVYWPAFSDAARTLDWTGSVEEAQKIIRAFGRYGMLAHIDGQILAVFSAKAWKENHHHQPGIVTTRLSREIVIALPDGYIILKEFHPIEGL